MPRSLQERWRERPRRRAQRLTPGTLTGSFTPSLAVARVRACCARSVQEIRATREPTCAARSDRRTEPMHSVSVGLRISRVLRQTLATRRS